MSDTQSNNVPRAYPHSFNAARHDKKKAKVTWIDLTRAINALKKK
jgi:hypothetical protein